KGFLLASINQNELRRTIPELSVGTNQNIAGRVDAIKFPRSFEQLKKLTNGRMFRIIRKNGYHPEDRTFDVPTKAALTEVRRLDSGDLTSPYSTCARDISAAPVLRSVPLRVDSRRQIQFFERDH